MRTLPLIALDQSLASHRLSLWLNEIAPNAHYAVRTDSVLALVSSAKAGVGIAALPVALGDAEPDLIRVLGPVAELTRAWCVLAHPDARNLPRVAAFFDFVVSETDALKPVLSG